MKSMMDAIRNRRMKNAKPEELMVAEESDLEGGEGADAAEMIMSLSPEKKQEILSLLMKDMGENVVATPSMKQDAEADEGEYSSLGNKSNDPSEDEEMEIAARMGKDNRQDDLSMDVANTLQDRKYKNADTSKKPRNLSERVQFRISDFINGKK